MDVNIGFIIPNNFKTEFFLFLGGGGDDCHLLSTFFLVLPAEFPSV